MLDDDLRCLMYRLNDAREPADVEPVVRNLIELMQYLREEIRELKTRVREESE